MNSSGASTSAGFDVLARQMIVVNFIPAPGADSSAPLQLKCKTGQSLMQPAVTANVDGIAADCGGLMTCATCHVYVREPHASQLPPPSADEAGMLEFTAVPRQPNSRLSCQIQLTPELDGLTVDLPETQH
jgi:ferredoxin, 2Fe-2S